MKKLITLFLLVFFSCAYASSTIKFVVNYVPGGPSDAVVRALQQPLSKELGQPVVVEYKPGAGGNIGIISVINSDPNDVVLTVNSPAVIINSLIKIPKAYDSTQLKPIAYLGRIPAVLAVGSKFPVTDLKQWKNISKPMSSGTSGAGTASHISSEIFKKQINKDIVQVHYKGQAQILSDLIAGNIDMSFLFVNVAIQHIQSGSLVPIAVDSENRLPGLPNTPTFTELGIDIGKNNWFIVFANQTQDQKTLARITTAFSKILGDAGYSQPLRDIGLEIPNKKINVDDFYIKEHARIEKVLKTLEIEK